MRIGQTLNFVALIALPEEDEGMYPKTMILVVLMIEASVSGSLRFSNLAGREYEMATAN